MGGSFLDTTIVIDVAKKDEKTSSKIVGHLRKNMPANAPYYALRELLAGYLQTLCQTHNILLAADNPGEAIQALLNKNPMEGRKREARVKELGEIISAVYSANPSGDRASVKREALEALALKVNSVWRRAKKPHDMELVQSLSCFNAGKISIGKSNELIGPRDSFNCIPSERCAAAAYLYEDKGVLNKLIDALHPDKLGSLANKNENQKRRKALKELLSDGPEKFNKGRCRALGDAYFAAMCPPGSDVFTTNIVDHMPLCQALKIKAVSI